MHFRRVALAALIVCGFALWPVPLAAQSFRAAGVEFEAARPVAVPADKLRPVLVAEFLHQGFIQPDGKNVLVAAKGNQPVPTRVLQLGPGDFCRVAFQTLPGQTAYDILYGGDPPAPGQLPAWTNRDGLVLEIRHFKTCDLNHFEAVRAAFESAEPIGADYVETVHHACNPFTLAQSPFLSRYRGQLHVASPCDYLFWTSSQDCSFLVIDGKVVVDSPGRHGPRYEARPDTAKKVSLTAGPHEFEYYHAAAGPDAMMVAAWSNAPDDPKPTPSLIPAAAFRAESIGRVEAGPATTRARKAVPDFRYQIVGDVPLPGEPMPMIGVLFENTSPSAIASGAKLQWDFGDGQTSDQARPAHVFLRPGVHRVSLSLRRGTQTIETTNRIEIDRPRLFGRGKEKPHTLDDYLPVVKTYDLRKLDAVSLRQLVLAYQWKSRLIEESIEKEEAAVRAEAEVDGDKPLASEPSKSAPRRPTAAQARRAAAQSRQERAARQAEGQAALAAAVEAGKTPFVGPSAAEGDEDLFALAELVGPIARVDLGDAPSALAIWQGAAGRVRGPKVRAECRVRAADVALGDLLDDKTAAALLDDAAPALADRTGGTSLARLRRVQGDLFARRGEGPKAVAAYREAQGLLDGTRSQPERIAWRGAHGRSTEQFLQTKDWARARAEIEAWQEQFPEEKIDGYWTLLAARYWAGREKYPQAVALAEELLAVNPGSPYADQLLWLGAQCELKQDHKDRAAAMLHSLLDDYPGSPLVPEARRQLDALSNP
ncbi:MAG: tetratricopeptide repeat protein [Pirellulales bacterium]|nr:tetratricopeptide repeat protein [Pirellulales bacterium]